MHLILRIEEKQTLNGGQPTGTFKGRPNVIFALREFAPKR